MRELALHLLDIAENSVAADAKTIRIEICEDISRDRLSMKVEDDGKGMTEEMVQRVTDPFVTSRTTRKVGLGLPLLKEAAEACNGSLTITSKVGKGTSVYVDFQRSHIDRMPLGDIATTFLNLLIAHPPIHFIFRYMIGEKEFYLDDETIKSELQGVSMTEPVVLTFLRNFFESGIHSIQTVA
ncbi:ATP-binding protein [Leptolinea tardivitalis]|uniref:histidine kinase n=1 Tax=Leptolinea tardivitalis TaxID=229920 RepID=A0A0P6X497_9CHLR|nr:ATP-binding protein [Leptolinea tardivitalis]KPL74710.1 histidine kinase [Leptolinea tardivitalis]GAP22927.1 histidine kinase [Leptolinea tardivitalis]